MKKVTLKKETVLCLSFLLISALIVICCIYITYDWMHVNCAKNFAN